MLLCSLLAAPTWAQGSVDGLSSLFAADGVTTSIVESHARVPLLPIAPTIGSVSAIGSGPLWSRRDGGQGWIGRVVALGQFGTLVFTEFDTAADRAELLSSFDVEPVTPLWSDPQVTTSQEARVDAAEEAGVFVSCRQIPVTGYSGPRNSFVSTYSAAHGGLDWTYQFPGSTYGPARAAVSRDGTRIVAGMLDTATGGLKIAVFNAASNVPVYTTTLQNGPQLHAFLLSADGSTLYWASGSTCNVWDVATHTTVGSFVLFTALDCHAISANGGVFAFGGFNTVDLFERQASGQYQHTHQMVVPGQAVCSRLDVSADGSTMVAGFNLWDFNVGVRIQALDVPTKTVTMTDIAIGAGTLQNIVSDVAVSANGDRFVVGLWGDEAGLVPELRFYRRDLDAPVATYDYPGSVYDVDISPDGHRVAVGTKAVHANLYAGGGAIELYGFEDEDLVARGIPSIGDKLRLEMKGPPNSSVRLAVSSQPGSIPFQIPNVGTLYPDRASLTVIPIGQTDSLGQVTYQYDLPLLPSAIGSTLCFQGFFMATRSLTNSWVRVAVLP